MMDRCVDASFRFDNSATELAETMSNDFEDPSSFIGLFDKAF
jgi:hypothetical protein